MNKSLKKLFRKILLKSNNFIDRPPLLLNIEYVNWLKMANAGMLNPGNIYCFDYIAKNLQSDFPAIEIGSFCGLSTNVINYFLRKYGKKNNIIVCDKWLFENANMNEKIGDSDISFGEYRQFIKNTFLSNINFFSRNHIPIVVEELSDQFFKLWHDRAEIISLSGDRYKLGGNISFCYIDGNHSYNYAKRDFLNVDKYLEKGGYILFDDSGDNSTFECAKLMPEILSNGNYKLVLKNPNYLFQKIN